MPRHVSADEEELARGLYKPFYNPLAISPVPVSEHQGSHYLFLARPLWGSLLFDNLNSDARDHCACERTFLAWLRLSVYMAVVSVAIVISFHLKHRPSKLERRMAVPLGLTFWVLALACLAAGFGNYIKAVTKYSRREALVQSGWKTQTVFIVVAFSIVASCILFLSTNARQNR
ncbi:MAG: hypothetical protein M1816_005728 [Peltula sp. TS41687]|nr:MAG: hypothetical protein M1816_005728 [Peltula sp. TS41687]